MGPEILSQLLLFVVPIAVDAPTPPVVPWEDVETRPDEYLGDLIQVHVQAHSRPGSWEPFLTRFSPGGFVALRAWSEAQDLWVKEHYDVPQVVVFARLGTHAARRLARAERHQRLVLACIPRELQAGMVWIEVVGARPTRKQVTEGTILHVEKALDLLDREAPGLAREQLVRALAAPLPEHARRELEQLVARCERGLAAARSRRSGFKRPGQ